MLKIGALAIFFLTFTTTNSISLLCENNPYCRCISINPKVVQVSCHFGNNGTKIIMNVKSFDYLQINCENWEGWENFNYTSNLTGHKLDSIQFTNCGISDEISLRDVIDLFGVKETETLIFKSSSNLNGNLRRKDIAGFPKVKTLNLSDNGLTNLTKDFLLDFPALEWIDLSDNKVILPNQIFDPTPNLKRIELYNNGLRTFDIRLINKLKNLEFLDLMGNELTEIEEGIFDDLLSLKTLLLDINNLSILPPYLFYELRNLELLDISKNNFSYIPSESFEKNKKLNKLYFHHNQINLDTLPDNLLSNLTNLEEVYLNNNGFKKLPENLFWGSIYITSINLNGNLLKTLSAMFFKDLKNVLSLEINNNLIKSLPDNIFKDMVNLDALDLSGNNMVYITNDLFKGLKLLTVLNMERNRIKVIEPTAFFPMEKLAFAKLSHNRISFNISDKKLNLFYNNTFLTELHLSNNSIKHFITDWPISENHLRLLDLSNNNITHVMANFFLIPSDRIKIDLRNNQIQNILFHMNLIPSQFFTMERDVLIFIDGNPILCDCILYDILRCRERKVTNHYYNYFKFAIGNLSCVQRNGTLGPKIKKLRTNTYLCSEDDFFGTKGICQNHCTCNIRLADMTRIMDCSNKGLSNFLINQSRVNFDNRYPIIINLTGNYLKEIPSLELLSKLNVTTLLLSNNNITQVTIDRIPKNLQILHLHNNNISRVTSDVMNYIKSRSLKEFTFRGNPIICDCHIHDFYLLVQAIRFYYRDMKNLMCKNISRPLYQLTFNDLVCPPEPRHYSRSIRNVVITFSVVILLTIVILIWYFKKDIRAIIPDDLLHTLVAAYAPLRLN
ncbi:hypothetical protein M0804_010645 [Polistes exclamans]|nr:hypothetical protein M0804_010645 [Polistes exclamans]